MLTLISEMIIGKGIATRIEAVLEILIVTVMEIQTGGRGEERPARTLRLKERA
jgi:hypothetical protein